jgi:eukaryotic-like serine/threonine-protein kinase
MVTRRMGTADPTGSSRPVSSSRRTAGVERESDPISVGRGLGHLRGGRFTLERELGSGGEGVVYLARDRLRRDRVAVKMLHLEGAASFGTLKREFRFLRGLIHPNLVPLYELFVDRDEAFFSMAFVDGKHFFYAAGQTHPLRPLLHQLLDVVSFLHQGGIVHRDIKPSNVLVRPDGRLVLVDFGAALHVHAPTQASSIVGTPEYMAPELFHGESPSPSSDAYSLGLILYEALTRKRPWQGQEVPRLREVVPEIPEDLDEFCASLLEFDPKKRATLSEARALLRFGPPSTRGQPMPGLPDRDRDVFTGRERELLQLETAYFRMLEGEEPVLLFVAGPSGMGKTALLERFRNSRPEALVLTGTCSDSESIRHKAFDSLLPMLIQFLQDELAQNADVLGALSRVERLALAQLFPELEELEGFRGLGQPAAQEAGARALQTAGYRALSRLLEAIAKVVPLVLLLDDLQWGDEDSARLLYEVFGSPKAPRCLLVFAYRSDLFPNSRCLLALRQGSDCLEDGLACMDVPLGPLGKNEALELAGTLSRGAISAERLQQITSLAEGSPFYITELIDAVQVSRDPAALPTDYETLLKMRLEALSAGARELFFLVSSSGALPVSRSSALKLGPIQPYVEELRTHRLCRTEEGGSNLVPFHDTVRTAALKAGGSGIRSLHTRLAEVWQMEPADASRVASHYYAAGELSQAELWAVRAGNAALAHLAVDKAVDFFRLALDCVPDVDAESRVERERQLAEALADAGRGAEAAPLLARLAEKAPAELAALYRRRAVEQWLSSGAVREGLDLLAQVHHEVGLVWPKSHRAAMMFAAYNRIKIALRAVPDGLPTSAAKSPLVQKRLETFRATWTVAHVSSTHGAANSARYLALALSAQDRNHLAYGLGMEACYRALGGTKARSTVERFREAGERLMPAPHVGYVDGFLAFVQAQTRYFLSDVKNAYPHFERADRVFSEECKNVSWELAASRLFWSSTLIFLGRLREFDRRMRVWLRDAQSRQDLYALVGLQLWYARRLALRDGDEEEALAVIDAATAGWTSPYLGTHAASARIIIAHTFIISGKPEQALEQMTKLEREVGTTMLRRVQILRVSWLVLSATSHLTLSFTASPSARKAHLHQVQDLTRRLAREKTSFADAAAHHFKASLSFLARPDEPAVDKLREAAGLYRGLGFELHAASIDIMVSQIVGGDEGVHLRASAETVFHRADVDTQGGPARSYAPNLSLGIGKA